MDGEAARRGGWGNNTVRTTAGEQERQGGIHLSPLCLYFLRFFTDKEAALPELHSRGDGLPLVSRHSSSLRSVGLWSSGKGDGRGVRWVPGILELGGVLLLNAEDDGVGAMDTDGGVALVDGLEAILD
ncbi:hypothetical protein OsI_14455 [Oryza sativa Indica Group]|uniref:Uncharacterized protein n=1 Tax=Oryza sativa subsp. indica TaxID=39946 RepID=A2XPE4_ORYSI|nr:hypothetical protein OsI_14455 [Oryza sativa Indica Group]